jgi:DNA-binding CsgD family transcriptional regulator
VGLLERVEEICRADLPERDLRVAVIAELRSAIEFDAYVWLLTDPVTGVGWSPVAELPATAGTADLPRIIGARYLTGAGRWNDLPSGTASTFATAAEAGSAGGHPPTDLPWETLLGEFGIADVLTVAFRDQGGRWGFLDLWRRSRRFAPDECAALVSVSEMVTPVLRRSMRRTFDEPNTAASDGPVVLLLADDLRLVGQTERTERYLEALLPPTAAGVSIPAAAYNVAAQLLALEAGVGVGAPQARVFVPGRSWMTIRAGRLSSIRTDGASIVVTIEPIAPSERSELFGSVFGLTGREAEVLDAVIAGYDTRRAAQVLAISEHTLQDHLKAIFAKTGTNSRRLLGARASGASH